mmetsp:Transcript_2834/g.2655  ORF Transcript_2834/g.2655 Transcript_2834/m.2655 type:complete len:103 (-) Transcript_2834:204-512(-)
MCICSLVLLANPPLDILMHIRPLVEARLSPQLAPLVSQVAIVPPNTLPRNPHLLKGLGHLVVEDLILFIPGLLGSSLLNVGVLVGTVPFGRDLSFHGPMPMS